MTFTHTMSAFVIPNRTFELWLDSESSQAQRWGGAKGPKICMGKSRYTLPPPEKLIRMFVVCCASKSNVNVR